MFKAHVWKVHIDPLLTGVVVAKCDTIDRGVVDDSDVLAVVCRSGALEAWLSTSLDDGVVSCSCVTITGLPDEIGDCKNDQITIRTI